MQHNIKLIYMNIKEHIQNKGFTISQVAALMTNKNGEKGITQSSLSQIINGNPSLDKLKEIASIIGISVSELLREEEDNILICPNCGAKLELKQKKG